MANELVVLCDGTGDSPEAKDRSRTNVQILREMLGIGLQGKRSVAYSTSEGWEIDKFQIDDRNRVVYYDRGLGAPKLSSSGSSTSWSWNPISHATHIYGKINDVDAQLTAQGIRDNMLQAYKFLVNNYQPGDKIYMFGFSRGAYTIRLIITMIRYIGLLDRTKFATEADLDAAIKLGFSIYDTNIHPDKNPVALEFRKNCHPTKELVHFLGLWDTVRGKVKESVRQDAKLSSVVKNARHALAIDEERTIFKPELWIASEGTDSEQRWFSGVHSDVGGGYHERDLANIPLLWMVNEAAKFGLTVDANSVKLFPTNPLAMQHDSLNARVAGNGTWKQLGGNYRRPVMQMTSGETLDDSVLIRYGKQVQHGNKTITYRPPILSHELTAFNNFKKLNLQKLADLVIPDADLLDDVGEPTSLFPKASFAMK